MKRIFLFLVTNIAVLLVLSVTLRLLGVDRILNAQGTGLDYNALLVMAGVIGFGGSFISLLMSKWMAKMGTGAHVIEVPSNTTERCCSTPCSAKPSARGSACRKSPCTTRPKSTRLQPAGTRMRHWSQ